MKKNHNLKRKSKEKLKKLRNNAKLKAKRLYQKLDKICFGIDDKTNSTEKATAEAPTGIINFYDQVPKKIVHNPYFETHRFEIPHRMIICGASGSGKVSKIK